MEKAYRDMMLASTLEVMMLPIFYWVYDSYSVIFWCLLYAMDAYLYKHMQFLPILEMQQQGKNRKEMRKLFFVEALFLCGLIFLLFYNIKLAGVLFFNDLILEGICLLNELKKLEK